MTSQLLILLMSALGIGLAVTPATSGINPGLFKGAAWLFRGIIFRVLIITNKYCFLMNY